MRTKEDSVEIVKDHCHFPDRADIEQRNFRKTLKDRTTVIDVTPRLTNFGAQGIKINKQLFIYQVTLLVRHVQSSGKTHYYNNDLNFREIIRMLLATAFLPVEDVPTRFEVLKGMESEGSHTMFNYLEDIYW